MASIAIYENTADVDPKQTQTALDIVEISDAEVVLLDLGDPYRSAVWSPERITKIQRELSARRMELVQVIRRRVLNEAKTNQWAPSMYPIFARHCSLSTELQLMDRVLPLVRQAESENLIIWFMGDERSTPAL